MTEPALRAVEDRAERSKFASMFASFGVMKPALTGVLEGRHGELLVDSLDQPRVAQCNVGPFAFLAGDPAAAVAERCILDRPVLSVLMLGDEPWLELGRRVLGDRIGAQPRVSYSCAELDPEHLRALRERTPAGTEIVRFDAATLERAVEEVDDDLLVIPSFLSFADFERHGVGYGALHVGRFVSGAVSAFRCKGALEIQINTHRDFERRGFARAVAVALLLDCLESGVEPHWDSAVPASQRLAEQLGYLRNSEYEWWFIKPE